jgi:hypothetical protein
MTGLMFIPNTLSTRPLRSRPRTRCGWNGASPRIGNDSQPRGDAARGDYHGEGKPYTQTEGGLPPLKPGTEALLLLERVDSEFRIVGTLYGAFQIVAGTLSPLSTKHGFAPEYRDVPADQALPSIARRFAAVQR